LGAVSHDWKLANDTLLVYIQALGAVASVAPAPSPSAAPLSGAAVAAKALPATQAAHIDAFASDIITYLQKREREREVRVFLEQVNTKNAAGTTDFAAALDALRAVGSSYRTLIFNECTDVTNLYVRALTVLATQRSDGSGPLIVERAHRIRGRWSEDLAACAVHESAAAAYLKTLDRIGATNDALVASERAPQTSTAVLRADIDDLSESVAALYAVVFTHTTPAPKPKASSK